MATIPAITFLTNKALIGAHAALVRAGVFTTSFTDEAVAPGTTMKIPVFNIEAATTFNKSTNNYGKGDADLSYADVAFNHVVKSFEFTDAQLTQAPEGVFAGAGMAVGRCVALAVSNAIETALKATDATGTALTLPKAWGKGDLASLISGLENAEKSVIVASPALFGQIIALFDAGAYGGSEAVRNGVLDGGVFGCKAVIKANITGADALVVPEDALVVATRTVPCGSPSVYAEVGTESDENGFTIGFRKFGDPKTGSNYVAAEAMIGAGIVQKAKVQKITVSAE